jgi:hypothetical protein
MGARRTRDQLARRGVGEMQPLEIDDDIARVGRELRDAPEQW